MKKILISISIFCIGISQICSVNALENEETINKYNEVVDNVEYSIITYDSKEEFKVDYSDSNGENHVGIMNKENKVVLVDGELVEYSIKSGISVKNTKESLIPNSTSDWTPVKVTTGYTIECSQIFETAGKITTALITIAGASLGAKLGSTYVGRAVGKAVGSYVGDKVSKINVIFTYDLYKTKNPVYVYSYSTVKTTGYRYQNYRLTTTYKGKILNTNTSECGDWWSASKPY